MEEVVVKYVFRSKRKKESLQVISTETAGVLRIINEKKMKRHFNKCVRMEKIRVLVLLYRTKENDNLRNNGPIVFAVTVFNKTD